MVFTKQYGFRFSSCKYCELTAKQRVLDVDFALDTVGVWRGELRQRVQATHSGTVHAVLASWEVYDRPAEGERQLTMSTHPDATLDNFPRDMQWGQGLQLIEDLDGAAVDAAPRPFKVTEGEWLILITRFSSDGVTVQFQLARDGPMEPEVN